MAGESICGRSSGCEQYAKLQDGKAEYGQVQLDGISVCLQLEQISFYRISYDVNCRLICSSELQG